jgi:hypothetical protein
MKMHLRALFPAALLAASCAAPAAVTPSAPPTTAIAAAASSSAPVATPIFAANECTTATATTRQVIERYLALSTSNSASAVSDCFAKAWRDKTSSFADGAAVWSHSGPATGVGITLMDVVNGCDRFGVNAQMTNPPSSAFRVPPFFSVGAEAGRMRIYETSTALTNASGTALRCG